MRIWSLHPQYLDTKGLVALWRETLLAKHVLEEKTKGYKNHPQLHRFKTYDRPLDAINNYLADVHAEATKRGYNFDESKFRASSAQVEIKVSKGQIEYELKHLLKKLKTRDRKKYDEVKTITRIKTHRIFKVVKGDVEWWEIIN